MSHYDTLGVDKNATQKDIKKAYRTLSKKHHPDVGGDDSKFKDVVSAYEIVGDPTKRQNYDALHGSHGFFNRHNNGAGQNNSMSDMFDQMFGNQSRQGSQKGPDYRIDMHISFDEAFSGTTKEFSVNGKNLSVNFKPGLKTGQKFRLKGKGGQHPYNSELPHGDAVINVQVINDGRFILQGNDIWVEHSLPWWEIMTGSKIKTLTPEGQIYVTINKGTKPGSNLRIKGKGYPIYNTGDRGDLLCRVNAYYPELNEAQLELIEQIKDNG